MQPSIRNLGTRVFQWVDRAGMGPAARAARAERRIRHIAWALGGYVILAYSAAVVAVVNVDGVRKYAEGNIMFRSRMETRRGDIVDRHGVTLATSLRSDSVSVNPRWLLPGSTKPSHPDWKFTAPKAVAFRNDVAERLARLIGRPAEEVKERVHRDSGFVYLAKNLNYSQSEAVRIALLNPKTNDGLPKGVTLEREFTRYYPNNNLAGPLVGRPTQTGSIEASFDQLLAGQQVEVRSFKDSSSTQMFFDGAPEPGVYGGHSLMLTIDERIQAIAEHHLDAATVEFDADFGIAAVMDVDTGEVLALAVSPSLNPNDSKNAPKYGWHNLALENQYEPGSTFKVFNLAIGLQERKISLTEVIATGAGYALPGKIIKDDHPHGQVTGLQSLQVSSNIANCKIAMRVNRERYYTYLKNLGFGRKVDLGIAGESNGQLAKPDKWSTVQYCNIAFGQGIAATPLQMTAAMAALANGGIYRRPKILREELRPDGKAVRPFTVDAGVRVFEKETAQQLLTAMASVTKPRDPKDPHSLSGTATRARMPNYSIGGKTGTAQQAENGHYSDTHWVGSFIGVTPIEKPKLVVFVAIDTPKKYDEKLGKIARYGGIVAAPVAREIARFALPYLNVPPSPGAPYLDKDDPERARALDEKNGQLAKKAAEHLVSSSGGPPVPTPLPTGIAQLPTAVAAIADAALQLDQAKVPDVRGLPMRVARLRMAGAGLHLIPSGSGLATLQAPEAGAVVARGSAVQAKFARLSEVPDVDTQVQADADAVEDAADAAKPDNRKVVAHLAAGKVAAAPAQPKLPMAVAKVASPVQVSGAAKIAASGANKGVNAPGAAGQKPVVKPGLALPPPARPKAMVKAVAKVAVSKPLLAGKPKQLAPLAGKPIAPPVRRPGPVAIAKPGSVGPAKLGPVGVAKPAAAGGVKKAPVPPSAPKVVSPAGAR